jgi:DNA repair protein RadA/Sms
MAQAGTPARLSTGLAELDRVLGGGLAAGAVVLLGGDPGIGKSTLLLQALAHLGAQVPVLYASGEESVAQIGARAQRLGLSAAPVPLLADSALDALLEAARGARVVVVDSIQTLHSAEVASAAGSVTQVRECAARLVRHAKDTGTAVIMAGHVTKEGALAGPRVLEHVVDTVLYFEGEGGSPYRMVRAHKNRFGSVHELGVFAMSERGLREVANPSAIFLTRHPRPVAGSVVLAALEGTRPLLVEVQALIEGSALGTPRRVCLGLDAGRLALVLAVLNRHAGMALHGQDVYVNLVGGMRVDETSSDLALALAVLSSLRDRPLPPELVCFGELGLAGEVRPVRAGPARLAEAAKLGFRHAVVSRLNAPRHPPHDMTVHALAHVGELVQVFQSLAASG